MRKYSIDIGQGQPHIDESIVVGSLVFSKPSFTALKSVIDVSAFAALSALVAIGVVGDPAASVSVIVDNMIFTSDNVLETRRRLRMEYGKGSFYWLDVIDRKTQKTSI